MREEKKGDKEIRTNVYEKKKKTQRARAGEKKDRMRLRAPLRRKEKKKEKKGEMR